MYHTNNRKAGVAILSNTIEFKTSNSFKRELNRVYDIFKHYKEGLFIIIKVQSIREDIIILNMYIPIPKYIK